MTARAIIRTLALVAVVWSWTRVAWAVPLSEVTMTHVVLDRDVMVLATPEGIWLAPRDGHTQHVVKLEEEGRIFGGLASVTRTNGGRVLAYLLPKEPPLRVRFDDDERTPALRPGRVEAIAVSPKGIVAATRRRFVERYDPATERVDIVELPAPFLANEIAYAPDETLYLVGSDVEKTALLAVRGNVATKVATFDTHVTRLWASKTAIWVVDSEGMLFRVDAASNAVSRHEPRVGKYLHVTGVTTAGGDLVAVSGELTAVFDGSSFVYPNGAVRETHGIAFDGVDASLYVIARDRKLVRVPVEHPKLVRGKDVSPRNVPRATGTEHGPIDEKAGTKDDRFTIPTVRIGYGVGFTPAETETTTEFDGMIGLRIGMRFREEPTLHLWPEVGYSASTGGNYVAAGAALQYGNYAVTAGPSLRALYGADQGGEGSGGIRTSLHVAFVSGLLQLEAGHQAMFQRGEVRHDTRALASVDLFTAGGFLFYLGVPVACFGGVLLTRAL